MDHHRGEHDHGHRKSAASWQHEDRDSGHRHDRGHHDRDGGKHDSHDTGSAIVPGELQTDSSVCWTLQGKGVTVEITAMLDDKGNVVLSYELTEGQADLNGLYLDIGNDGGPISSLGCGNNMRGSDTDGDKLDGFDFAQKLGSTGGHDADNTGGTVVVSMADLGITSLAELADSEIGVRATSVGESRDCSVKLADTGELCEDEKEPTDPGNGGGEGFFPTADCGATRLTLVFSPETDGAGNWFPATGDQNEDWYYTVQINLSGDVPKDADDYIQQLLADLNAADVNIHDGSNLKGMFIESDCGETGYYAYGYSENGDAPDDLPGGFEISLVDGTVGPTLVIDATFSATATGDAFLFDFV